MSGGNFSVQTALTYLVACSGACSNLGQLSSKVLLGLAREGYGKPFCLAGLAAHLPGFLERAKQGEFLVIDGCPQQCALKTVEHAGFKASQAVVIAKLGVEKSNVLDIPQEEVEKVLESAKEALACKGGTS
ncbi:MAG: putative zinc-binding protein [Bacillota bacterium]|nr:putative zinc-binding protein [Bacillota bacterium]